MKRRVFFKKGLALSSGLLLMPSVPSACSANTSKANNKSRVVISRDERLQSQQGSVDSDRLLSVLDSTIQSLCDRDNPLEAWKKIVKPGEVVGLKVNCLSGYGATHIELVDAICERLQGVGIKAEDIIIWDRLSSDLEDAGFKIKYKGKGVRCFGNDALGFDRKLEVYGSAGSMVCKTLTRVCNAVINLPLLKDHSIAGVTISLKNLFGAIHNPHKYHLNTGNPYIADVNMLPSIRGKIRLNICDAITAQYEGGPSFMPQWRWKYNGLIAATDQVALDYIGWKIIEQKRAEMSMKSLKEVGREPVYINTAADSNHRLGMNDPKKIEVIKI